MISGTTAKTRLGTYVMNGPCSERALDTYHLILAPSFACNLACRHCYLPDHAARSLAAERVFGLVDEWSEIVVGERGPFGGIFHLKGGEPLLLPYFGDVLDRLAQLGTLQFMTTTNGTLGDWDVVERLNRLNDALDGHATIIVSIDGSNEAVNAQLRPPGGFEKAVAFVRRLTEAGINVFLNNVVHRDNLDDIEPFVALALELDVTQVNFLSFVPKGFGASMALQRPDSVEVFERIQAIWDRGDDRIHSLLAGSLSDVRHAESCGTRTSRECVSGYRGLLYVVPDGTACSCPNLNHPGLEAGNILTSPLAQVHDALSTKVYERIRTPEGETHDRYLCKGETSVPLLRRCDYQDPHGVQRHLVPSELSQGTSYCFSRNF